MIAFQVKHAGFPGEFYAEKADGTLLATIAPRTMLTGKVSDRFLNVCFMDGSVEIADGMEHANDLIEQKHFKG